MTDRNTETNFSRNSEQLSDGTVHTEHNTITSRTSRDVNITYGRYFQKICLR